MYLRTLELYTPIQLVVPCVVKIADGGVYRLTDLSAEQFATNPSQSGWQFEKFTYATGRYSLFTQYSDSCAANYVDIYQLCRSGGERVKEATNGAADITPEMFWTYCKVGGTPHLDGQYTVFGEVTEGIDVVERIQKVYICILLLQAK